MKPNVMKQISNRGSAVEEEKKGPKVEKPKVNLAPQVSLGGKKSNNKFIQASVNLCREKVGTFRSLFTLYRQSEKDKYKEVQSSRRVRDKLEKVVTDLYLRTKKFPECVFIYIANSMSFKLFDKAFQRFYYEFDTNSDRRMQKEELERCIDYLAKEENLGREKMLQTLKFMDISVDTNLGFLKEGAGGSIVDAQVSGQLYDKLTKSTKIVNGESVVEQQEDVDFLAFLPYSFAFFIEFEIKKLMKRKYFYDLIKGYPRSMLDSGKMVIDYGKTAAGPSLYKVFVDLLYERHLDVPIITYRTVEKALKNFRSQGFSDYFRIHNMDQILKQVRKEMNVDEYTNIEESKKCLNEIIPPIALQFCISHELEKLREKKLQKEQSILAEEIVNWNGAAQCKKLTKDKIHDALDKYFRQQYGEDVENIKKEDFQNGFSEILKKIMPQHNPHMVGEITHNLLDTTENGFVEQNKDRPDKPGIEYIRIQRVISEDNIFKRMLEYSYELVTEYFLSQFDPQTFDTEESRRALRGRSQTIHDQLGRQQRQEPVKQSELFTQQDSKNTHLKNRIIKNKLEKLFEKYLGTIEQMSVIGDTENPVTATLNATIDEEEMRLKTIAKNQLEANTINAKMRKKKQRNKEIQQQEYSRAFPYSDSIDPLIYLETFETDKQSSKGLQSIHQALKQKGSEMNYTDFMKYSVMSKVGKKINKDAPQMDKLLNGKNKTKQFKRFNESKVVFQPTNVLQQLKTDEESAEKARRDRSCCTIF